MQRRLAAILVADMVGYSRMMRADEVGTLSALRKLRADVIDPTLNAHHGRIVKLMGDGLLAEFSSVVDAVSCTAELQTKLANQNAALAEEKKIHFRAGVNLGDVIIDDDDIQGDGVNLAARLETLSEADGMCISDAVHEQIRDRLDLEFTDLGEQLLKNIDRPLRAWSWKAQPPIEALDFAESNEKPALPDKASLAVLPFDNMSGDPEQDYFADGMVEDMITEFSRNKWLFVISRNSSFTYKGKAVDIKQVGLDLGVRYVLEGSVRKAGNRIRITGQLIDAASGAHIWADKFDGELADIFDLQDRVTQSVVGTIAPKLEQEEIKRIKRKPTESLDAYDYYLRGIAAFYQFTREANADALTQFTRAFELDPEYAAAYGMAARTYGQRKGFGWISDLDHDKSEASRLAWIAVRLGGDDAIALAAAGFALILFGEITDGDAFLDKALAANPNHAAAWHISGMAKAMLGQTDQIIERASHAIRLSPQDPQLFAMHATISIGHIFNQRYEEAHRWASDALRQNPKFLLSLGATAISAAFLGKQTEAENAISRMQKIAPHLRISNLSNWINFQRAEEFDLWSEGFRKAGLPE